jgi:hypothetical protein
MAGFVVMGDLIIGGAAFVAGVYFADIVKAPIFAAINWVKAKF